MKYKQLIFLAVFWVFCALLVSYKPVEAQYYSQTDSKQALVIDKKLRAVDQKEYFDNLTSSQKVFVSGEVIEFKVIVKNSGSLEINNIQMEDNLPANLEMIFFPGEYKKDLNKVVWKIEKLDSGESKEYLIRAKIVKSDEFAKETKRTNKASGCSDTSVCDNDTASYVIKGRTMPTTGSNILLVESLMTLAFGAIGLGMRKMSRGY